jgi:hypothetical protein
MFVRTPFRELREVIEDLLRVRVKDVRAVFVHEHARFIRMIVGVAGYVRPAVDEQDFLARVPREAFSEHAPGVARANNQVIIHIRESADPRALKRGAERSRRDAAR